ncbi:Rossmann fold nucleotide-binding protein Smf possibly involved in DNA uptake [Alloactinosynnema sp. L-07]|nr:Rossmann fold nucleotide-binding protein Smf possibly involved in DNA uptake [Alloactinosynnema sp. L-07]
MEVHGPVEAAELLRSGEAPTSLLDATFAQGATAELADSDFAAAAAVDARLVIPEDNEWPAAMALSLHSGGALGLDWAAAPVALWVRGPVDIGVALQRAVSVTGARAATGYGEHVAGEFGFDLGTAGVTVVSGASYGVDGAVHRGALNAEGPTIAVLPCGVDVRYPAAHSLLLDRIASTGAVVSEYPPGTPPAKHRCAVRNRLLATSAATVIVEAGIRSGARNVARSAKALGKTVLAVPGPITSAMSKGCHDLLRDGTATVVDSAAQVLSRL